MIILGINAYHANASAAIVVDGRLIAAVEEERLNRIKYAAGLPSRAVQYCLDAAGVKLSNVDHIALPRDPWARLGTKLRFALRMPRFAMDRFKVAARFGGMKEELASSLDIDPQSIRAQFHRIEHHRAHLASTFFVSPFERAAVLSADGLGDFASTMWGVGEGSNLRVAGCTAFPHSLGMFYTAMTQYLGFRKFGEEYKVMGLAAYGSPAYDGMKDIVRAGNPLGVYLNLRYFTHHKSGPEMSWKQSDETPVVGGLYSPFLEERFGPARTPDQPIESHHKDFAASMQARVEDVLLTNINALYEQTKSKTLCLAGGVAFNCVANGKILERTPFEKIYVQPAAGDGGLSVGAAFAVYHEILGKPRSFQMDHAFWGPGFEASEVRSVVANKHSGSADVQVTELSEDALLRATATHISQGKIVGWFQGRAEWGPRALGNRSILADPRRADMKDTLNRRIKHREIFRPFAPSILEEGVGEYFEQTHPSPFMTFAYPVRPAKRKVIPAPTHVDGTARLQTVNRDSHPLYWRLLRTFGDMTGVPVLLNTSFNDNEPIVCRPEEALACFERTKMDVLVLGNFVLEKKSAKRPTDETSAEVLGTTL